MNTAQQQANTVIELTPDQVQVLMNALEEMWDVEAFVNGNYITARHLSAIMMQLDATKGQHQVDMLSEVQDEGYDKLFT